MTLSHGTPVESHCWKTSEVSFIREVESDKVTFEMSDIVCLKSAYDINLVVFLKERPKAKLLLEVEGRKTSKGC